MLTAELFARRSAAKSVILQVGGLVTPRKRPDPGLPPGPARDLMHLFQRLRDSSQLRIGQIATRTRYSPSHISEVLSGWKSPSPDAAEKIARALGADDATARRAR